MLIPVKKRCICFLQKGGDLLLKERIVICSEMRVTRWGWTMRSVGQKVVLLDRFIFHEKRDDRIIVCVERECVVEGGLSARGTYFRPFICFRLCQGRNNQYCHSGEMSFHFHILIRTSAFTGRRTLCAVRCNAWFGQFSFSDCFIILSTERRICGSTTAFHRRIPSNTASIQPRTRPPIKSSL